MKRKKRKYVDYSPDNTYEIELDKCSEIFAQSYNKTDYRYRYMLKEIRAGEQLEIAMYPVFRSDKELKEAGIRKESTKAQKNLNDKNAKLKLERLINNNFTYKDIWITLTYTREQEPGTIDEALKDMQNYIRRINGKRKKRGLGNAKYIYVTEHSPEDKIRFHHHMIIDGEISMDELEELWHKGERLETRRLDPDENGLSGIAAYITKMARKRGEKRWKQSKGLKLPEEKIYLSKKPDTTGNYRQIKKYVKEFILDENRIEEQMKKWYPDYQFSYAKRMTNDFNGKFYIYARLRKRKEVRDGRKINALPKVQKGKGG